MNCGGIIRTALALTVVAFCLFEFSLHRLNHSFHEFEDAIILTPGILFICAIIWCGTFLFLTFSRKDWPLVALLFVAVTFYYIGQPSAAAMRDAFMLLAGIAIGRGTQFILKREKKVIEIGGFLVCLVVLLAFSAWWHPDMTDNYYHGPRWMGLWDSPNTYGILMSAGVTLAIGLFATKQKVEGSKRKLAEAEKIEDCENEGGKRIKLLSVILPIAAFMMSVGLIFSYSRGAWLGTVVGLLYLAKFYEKLKWRPLRAFLLSAFCFLLFGVWYFWNATPDTASWYVKRMDLGRPSAQHRVAAWCGALQIMQRHPLGVGWGNGITIYKERYAPPDGARALNTNDYFLLGTQLGLPGLLCFIAYVALCFRNLGNRKSGIGNEMACRAGALALLVALWFDGALFDLPTASVFWILLELGGSILPNR